MHFAYPPRKSSNPPPFRPRSSKIPIPLLRRSRLKTLALVALAIIGLVYIFSSGSGGSTAGGRSSGATSVAQHTPSGYPPVVIVTVLDERAYSESYIENVRQNRIQYAQKHGYETFFPGIGEYNLHGSPPSWSRVVAMRHALSKFPDCKYIWYLDEHSYIMNPSLTLEGHIMNGKRLESLMIKDHPVVPPDSIIRTFSHLRGDEVDFVLTQDREGLSAGSFVIRNGDWARFFLDTWFDPLYRSYNFQKAETHALEHIVQWHPTILSKLAIVPQRILNSYSHQLTGDRWEEGDLVVRFPGCQLVGDNSCENEAASWLGQWQAAFNQ